MMARPLPLACPTMATSWLAASRSAAEQGSQ